MKIAFVIGHHSKSKGALSKFFNAREYDFYNEVVKYNLQSKGKDVTIFRHNPDISGYTTRIKDTAKRINKGNFDLVIEAHYNAFNKSANGCETLYFYASRKGKVYAKEFSKLIHDRTGIKLRHYGLKALANKKDRGFASVYYPKPPTILIEPFFGDNVEDCKKIESPENMASIIQEFIANVK